MTSADFFAPEDEIAAPTPPPSGFSADMQFDASPDTGLSAYFPAGIPANIGYTITIAAGGGGPVYKGAGAAKGTVPGLTVAAGQSYQVVAWGSDDGVVTWFQFQLGGQYVWIDRNRCNKPYAISYKQIPAKTFSAAHIPVIYLSPSLQTTNKYAAGNTTEAEQMNRVANSLKTVLEQRYECVVYIPDISFGISFYNRPLDAYNKGADVYLAIHSNAANPGVTAYGCETYTFSGGSQQSLQLGQNIVAEMQKIKSGVPASTITFPVKNGMAYWDNVGYGEVRDPSHLGIVAALVEVEFHDRTVGANWIINNTYNIAGGLANALHQTFNFPAKGSLDQLTIQGRFS